MCVCVCVCLSGYIVWHYGQFCKTKTTGPRLSLAYRLYYTYGHVLPDIYYISS